MRAFAFPLAAALLFGLGCEPMGPIAGGRLKGDVAGELPADWSFTDSHDTVQLETHPESPHSVTVWCVSYRGRLYVPTRNPDAKRWVGFVLEDPRVRIRIGGILYEGVAVRVTDEQELEWAVPALLAKYEIESSEIEGAEAWLFRIDPRPPPARAQEGVPSSAAGSAESASRSG